MDILRFVNSKDIRNYLGEVGYKFSSLEAAWLIYQCRNSAIEEKHRAWEELIRTMPDCEVSEKPERIKIWLDDEREAPAGFLHCRSVNEAKRAISECEAKGTEIDVIDCDHDLGDYAWDGGDGIKLIDWLAERGTFYPIELHTMNPVGRENMQREIDRYWKRRE